MLPGIPNCRSLHSAPPDFLLRALPTLKFVRLSFRRVACVAAVEWSEVGNPGTLRSR